MPLDHLKEKNAFINMVEEIYKIVSLNTINEQDLVNKFIGYESLYDYYEKSLSNNIVNYIKTNDLSESLVDEEDVHYHLKDIMKNLLASPYDQIEQQVNNAAITIITKKTLLHVIIDYLNYSKLTPNDLGLSLNEVSKLFIGLKEVTSDINYQWLLDQFSTTSLRLLLYSLVEDKINIFRTLNYDGELLFPKDGKLFLGETKNTKYQDLLITSDTFRVYFDRLVMCDNGVYLEGFYRLPNFQPKQFIKNKLSLVLKSDVDQKVEAEFNVNSFFRRDLQNLYIESNGYVGIKIKVSLDLLKKGNYKFYLRVHGCKGETDYFEETVIAATIFNRYKGYFSIQNKNYFISVLKRNEINLGVKGKQSKVHMNLRFFVTNLQKIFNLKTKRFKTGYIDRLLYLITYPILKNKNIWLISERGDTCQDNSYHLFKHIRKSHPKQKIYYIIDKSSKDYKKVESYGNIIDKDSYKHRMFILHAKVLINSYDVEAYTKPSMYSKTSFLKNFGDILRYKTVFLQHGITYNDVSSSMSKNRIGNDMIITSLPEEKEFIRDNMNYDDAEIQLTGFPRYDNLKYKSSNKEEKEILLMPTWRRDIVPKSYLKTKASDFEKIEQTFLESDYFKFYNSLLNSQMLRDLIEEHNITFKFYPHYEVQPFIGNFNFSSDKIKVLSKDSSDVQELLISADLLITDYSSVFFDFLLMEKPVIFCHFDYEDFYNKQYKKGYFDLSSRDLGYVTTTADEVVENVKKVVHRNFKIEDIHKQNVNDMFYYKLDNNYSERVYKKIKETLN